MFEMLSQRLMAISEAEEILRRTEIGATGPGTILRDFDALLAYIGESEMEVTATGLPPLRALPEINRSMRG